MKPKVYIETSIPSYYHEIRDDPESAAKRLWTREWWAHHRFRFELLTAPPVLDELERGDYPTKQETLQFIAELPLLAVNEEIAEIVREYLQHHIMPNDPSGDALHLALASYYNCQFLLTWNCRHLANTNKFEQIRHINTLPVPILTTPFQLMQEDMEDDQTVERIRQVRHEISAECGHDPGKLIAYYMQYQKKYVERMKQRHSSELTKKANLT